MTATAPADRAGAGAVHGYVAEGYEPVRELFEQGRADLGAGGGAFAAYVDGRPVADLWTGDARPGQPWAEDTLAVIMSATKGLTGLCVQILVDRGELDLEAPVARYWPEFAQQGKADVRVRHVMTHTSGVLGFDDPTSLLKWDGTGWDDQEEIARRLAAAAPSWPPGTQHGYHALSVGWLVGELVRRITGASLGTFFREEVALPLGLDARIGTPVAEQHRVASIIEADPLSLPPEVGAYFDAMIAHARDPRTLTGRAFLADGTSSAYDHLAALLTTPRSLAAETPASNGTATARSLARLYALMSMGGELDGVRLVSERSMREFSVVRLREPDLLMTEIDLPGAAQLQPEAVARTFAYQANGGATGLPMRFGPNPAAFGAEGMGGQITFCDMDNRVAVGFVRNALAIVSFFSTALIHAVYACAGLG